MKKLVPWEEVRPGDTVTFLRYSGLGSGGVPEYRPSRGRVVFAYNASGGEGHLTVNAGGAHGTPVVVRYEHYLNRISTGDPKMNRRPFRNPRARLVRGDRLSADTIREIKSAFGYRWTKENETRAREWFRVGGHAPPRVALVSDAEWIRDHAFYVTKDGRLAAKPNRAEPHYMADGARGNPSAYCPKCDGACYDPVTDKECTRCKGMGLVYWGADAVAVRVWFTRDGRYVMKTFPKSDWRSWSHNKKDQMVSIAVGGKSWAEWEEVTRSEARDNPRRAPRAGQLVSVAGRAQRITKVLGKVAGGYAVMAGGRRLSISWHAGGGEWGRRWSRS